MAIVTASQAACRGRCDKSLSDRNVSETLLADCKLNRKNVHMTAPAGILSLWHTALPFRFFCIMEFLRQR
ncbi:hypothetical protein ABTJ37_22210, partial [Acinetobacter baumannii]